jgi:hypothetical protein
MYTLRQVTPNGVIHNEFIGTKYSVIHRSKASNEFESLCEIEKRDLKSPIIAFVLSEGGKVAYPIWEGAEYFIVTESGKTFERIN